MVSTQNLTLAAACGAIAAVRVMVSQAQPKVVSVLEAQPKVVLVLKVSLKVVTVSLVQRMLLGSLPPSRALL